MSEVPKEYQVWTNHYSEGWSLTQFDTFSECVEYLKSGTYGETMITRLVCGDVYTYKIA